MPQGSEEKVARGNLGLEKENFHLIQFGYLTPFTCCAFIVFFSNIPILENNNLNLNGF